MKSSFGVAAATSLALVTVSGCSTMQEWWPWGHHQEETTSSSAAATASPAPMAEASAAPEEPASAPTASTAYACDNGVRLAVTFEAASANVSIDGAPSVQLPKVPAEQESFYTNGRFTLTAKSGAALWGVGRAMPVHCTSA